MLALIASSVSRSLGEVLGPYGWIAVLSYAISAAATPLVRALAWRVGIVDRPDGLLKVHDRPIAYLGGVAVYLGWLAGMLTAGWQGLAGTTWVAGLSLAGGMALAVGLADDLLQIRPSMKLLGQVAAAVVLLSFGVGHDIGLVVIKPIRMLWPHIFF